MEDDVLSPVYLVTNTGSHDEIFIVAYAAATGYLLYNLISTPIGAASTGVEFNYEILPVKSGKRRIWVDKAVETEALGKLFTDGWTEDVIVVANDKRDLIFEWASQLNE